MTRFCVELTETDRGPGIQFPDGDIFLQGDTIASFLMHCEVLGVNLDNGFWISDEEEE